MQSFQVIEQVDSLCEALNSQENNEFIFFLNILDTHRETLELSGTHILDEENTNTDISRFVGEHRNNISVVKKDIKKNLRTGSVFAAIRRLGDLFRKLECGLNQENECLSNIKSQLESFENVYEEFVQEYSSPVIMKLVNAGTDLLHSLKSAEDVFNAIRTSLQSNYNQDDDSLASLSLLLDAGSTYRDFVRKLEAIQNLYSKFCSLTLIQEEDFPLKIAKIESGSLFVKIFGESRVIGLMLCLVQNTIGFAYRNTTKEGMIESIHQKKAVLESLLEMRKSFHQAGFSTEDLDKELNKSAIFIAEELNYLLIGESRIKINGEVLRLGNNNNKQKLLDSHKQYLIEGAKDNSKQND